MINRTEKEIMQNWQGDIGKLVVSVCSITYNHESYIAKALDGFLMQETTFPFEIVIDDDCSLDGTAEIIKRYMEKYPKIIKANLRDKNIGMMPNFIANLKRAGGKYIAICEGDDYWTDKSKLQIQKNFLDSNDDFVMTTHAVTTIDNTIHTSAYSAYRPNPKAVNTFKDILIHHFIPTLSLFFRQNALPHKYPAGYAEIRSGDIFIELILASQGKCFYSTRKMGVYRHHDGGITKSVPLDAEELKKKQYILYNAINKYTHNQYNTAIKQRLAFVDYGSFRQYLRQREYRSALNELINAIKKDKLIFYKVIYNRITR